MPFFIVFLLLLLLLLLLLIIINLSRFLYSKSVRRIVHILIILARLEGWYTAC
jgi:hypothetical protein